VSGPKLTKPELQIMETVWTHGGLTIRDIFELLPGKKRPAYTTVQTVVNRLEGKKALRRTDKVGKAYIFEAAISRSAAQKRLVDDLLAMFGGRMQPIMSQLIQSRRFTQKDVENAEAMLKHLSAGKKNK
jgi:BlaI family penicillinase repressor